MCRAPLRQAEEDLEIIIDPFHFLFYFKLQPKFKE